MPTTLRKLLSPPIFNDDEDKSRAADLLNAVILTLLALALITLPASLFLSAPAVGRQPMAAANLALHLLLIAMFWALRQLLLRGIVALVAWLVLVYSWLSMAYIMFTSGTISNILPLLSVLTVLFALYVLGRRAGYIALVITGILMTALTLMEQAGQLPAAAPFDSIDQLVYYLIASLMIFGLASTAQQNILMAYKSARENQAALSSSNQELLSMQASLEERVSERTFRLEQRAAQLQTISSMARTIVSMQDLDTLLPSITRLVSDQFGLYHAGIFLLDEAGEYAVLAAANSEGGSRMLRRGHRLRLDSDSIVGYATSRGEPRIALDVGADSVYFNNPDLPQTRSEAALPLRVTGRVIGALDVQSTARNAFSEDDIFVLYTLADQIAIAIENARLYGQAQRALQDSQATFDRYVKQEWNGFVQQARHTGFVFDGKQVVPLTRQTRREYVKPVIQTGSLSLGKSSATVAVPIKLRGQTIGVLDVRSKKGSREWSRDEIALLEAAAERAALALENARLVESAQRRAARERSISEISAKIGSVSDVESILQAAVEELGRKLSGGAEVTLEIKQDDRQASGS